MDADQAAVRPVRIDIAREQEGPGQRDELSRRSDNAHQSNARPVSTDEDERKDVEGKRAPRRAQEDDPGEISQLLSAGGKRRAMGRRGCDRESEGPGQRKADTCQRHQRPARKRVHTAIIASGVDQCVERSPFDDRYASLLADIRRLMRAAVRDAGGHEVDARADELFAVFEETAAAVEAALAIQRAMRASAWPGGVDVRVRIGVHHGRPTLTDTGYVGLSVHTAARICYAAHGGQIVISSAVRSAALGSLADGVSLSSLGTWRFQGLREPEDLYQVEAADLPADFPPLRAVQPGTRS